VAVSVDCFQVQIKSEEFNTTEKKPTLLRQKSEDVITLSAHGICPVGK